MESTMDPSDLRSRIQSVRRTNPHHKTYIPDLSLASLVTPQAVYTELRIGRIESYLREEITEKVMADARKVFAILVLIEEVHLLKDLMGQGRLLDHSLPLSLTFLVKFGAKVAIDFYETQWEFLASRFTRSMITQLIPRETALPFLKDEKIGEGGFGEIYEISLDPDHQELRDGLSKRLVRKELNEDCCSIELKNLAILSLVNHPNILEILGAYRYKERCNLIFPLADGGDLADLFKRQRKSTPFHSDETCLVALSGLASALEHVHDFTNQKLELQLIGCHYDFRPRNILVSGEMLILADFGLSQFRDADLDSKTLFKRGVDHYLAPECETLNEFKKSRVGRPSDIWSFGCILTEILVYMESDMQGVKQFEVSRSFTEACVTYAYFHRGRVPNPSVERCLFELANSEHKRNADIVALIRRMLALNEAERPKARDVTTSLRFIVISEVARSIAMLYKSLCDKEESLDAFLQLRRFDATMYGLRVVDHQGCYTAANPTVLGTEKFNLILKFLNEMRDCLKLILHPNAEVLMAGFRDLDRLNDYIANVLDKEQQEQARIYFSSTFLESKFSEFSSQTYDNLSLLALDRQTKMRSALKTMTKLATMHTTRDFDKRQIRPELVKDLEPFGNHHLGRFLDPDTSVLVEWRLYAQREVRHTVLEELFIRLECLVDLLSMEKPEGFCSLPCRGFFHDVGQCRFGVVYDLPLHLVHSKVGPITLQKLINDKKTISKQPNLEDKFNLALALANALLEFHLVGWLHKDIATSNVIFCHQNAISQSDMVREPFIIGFNHSRPDELNALTVGKINTENEYYQHPDYQHDVRRFRIEYDYYSFGIVLLEIGFWTTIGKWKTEWTDNSKRIMPARELHDKLLQFRVPFLRQVMGSCYMDAVKTCLMGNFGISDDGKPHRDEEKRKKALQLRFERLVVDRLRKRLV